MPLFRVQCDNRDTEYEVLSVWKWRLTPTHSPVLLQPASPFSSGTAVSQLQTSRRPAALLRAGSRILGTGRPILCLGTPILQSSTKMLLCHEDVCPSNASIQFLLKLMVPTGGATRAGLG